MAQYRNTNGTVVCIAGMHRSGTSMLTRILSKCGLYLGPQEHLLPATSHNSNGHWENAKFVEINDAILNELGGGWDFPPVVHVESFDPNQIGQFRSEALELIASFPETAWGWKDPRNCLTFPFWREIIPSLKVVVCLRNPIEVALSLHRRNYLSYALGLHLWSVYNSRLLETSDAAQRILTHYDAYFVDAPSELRRLLSFLNLSPSEETIDKCCELISGQLRHNRFTTDDLRDTAVSADVVELYLEMCAAAGMAECPSLRQQGTGATKSVNMNAAADKPSTGKPVRLVDKPVLETELLRREVAAYRALVEKLRQKVEMSTVEPQRLFEKRFARIEQILSQQSAELDRLRLDYNQLKLEHKQLAYCGMVQQIRSAVEDSIPSNVTVLVVSKGDDELLRLGERTAWHYPQTESGEYTGYYPASSAEAIDHLQSLRSAGGKYLVLPQSAFWWLEHYQEFGAHLNRRYRCVYQGSSCRIYNLTVEM